MKIRNNRGQYAETSIRERFSDSWIPEPNSGCWLWIGAVVANGYGSIKKGITSVRAHRAAWGLFRGPIPNRKCVLHKCDTPLCVNPDHLFLGSHSDNTFDMINKGRQSEGEKHPASRLKEADVRSILASTGSESTLADKFHVSRATIYLIRNGKRWKHLTRQKAKQKGK